MYEDTQEEFVKALTKGKQLSSDEGPLKVTTEPVVMHHRTQVLSTSV